MNKSRKAFALEFVGGVWRMRVPAPSGQKYIPTAHFLSFEESNYLEDVLKGVPYATFKTDNREEMENILQNGYKDKAGVIWSSFFAYWKDQEGHAFLTHKSAGIRDLRDVGVKTFMKSPADTMKVSKYANRLFAALGLGVEGVWGKEVSWNEADQIAIVHVDVESVDLTDEDKDLAVRYVDLKTLNAEQKALVDGAIVVSEKACRVLGLSKEPRLGMAWRGTFGTERGLGKGHILYKNDMSVDVVIYGPKTILKTDKFFFGNMGELHVGVPHTDRQAFVNFHFHRPGLAVDLAKKYMVSVVKATRDEEALRRLLLHHSQDLAHADMDGGDWILRQALSYGVSYLRFPGLYRRVVRYLMTKVMACDDRARIPMDSIAGYGYVLPDPNAIDSVGDVVLENAIPEGHIVFPDVAPGTKVVCYRQPSENTNAWMALTVTYRPEYKRFANRGICLLGRGADKVLGRLGGGDMDDSFVIVHDPKWVEAFHTMRPYPETEKVSADVTEEDQLMVDPNEEEFNRWTNELIADMRDPDLSHYTNKHVSWQIDMAKNARAGIGPVVNFGMMDMLMSDPDQKQSMMADLLGTNNENFDEAAMWLEDREPWQAAFFMTNLEVVIDGSVKDTTLLRKLGDVSGTIKRFHKNCRVYPASMSGRIPASKLKSGDYVTARSLTCRALESIRHYRDRVTEILAEREWDLVAPADGSLRSFYPFEREINIRLVGEKKRTEDGEWIRVNEDVRSIKDIWAQEWVAEMSQDKNHEGAYERICNLILEELYGADDDMMERLAVQLYYQTYKSYSVTPKIDEVSGRIRSYPDGLLWSPVFGNHFIMALRRAELCGFYKVAEIRPEFRRRLMDKSVVIQIRNRNVFIQDSDDKFTIWVGFVIGKCADGKFRMDGGLIEFIRPQEICRPKEHLMLPQKPVTRVIPPAPKEEQKEEPKSGFGKILDKAMDILGFKKDDETEDKKKDDDNKKEDEGKK